MAKHAKRRKKPTRRRRRIGATAALSPSSPLVQYGSIAAGFLFGDKINTALDNVVGSNIDSKIIAGGQLGVGYLLALRKGGKKNLIMTVAGGAMLGAGAKRALGAFGLGAVGGYQMVPAIRGYSAVPAVGYTARKRVGSYAPGGSRGLNGYKVTRQTVGATGLMDAGR